MSSTRAGMMMLLVSAIWGCGYVMTQFALDANWKPFQLLAGRFLIGSIVLSVIFYKKFASIRKEDIIAGSILGLLLLSGFILQILGQIYSTPAITAFVTTTCVILVPFLDWGIYKKKPDIYVGIAAFMTFIGVMLISLTGSMELGFGVVLTLLGTVFYAIHICSLGHFTKKVDPIRLTIVTIYFSAVISLIAAILVDRGTPDFTFKGVGTIMFLGVISTGLCFLLQSISQKYMSATEAGVILSTESVFGAIGSVIMYKEIMSLQTIVGCAIVFAAVITAETKWEFLRKCRRDS